MEDKSKPDCGWRSGALPECAPLAMSYTPMQQSSEPAYGTDEALTRGTLFPGLDLPFMNIVNKMPANTTPLRELMALDFIVRELNLYLDTHRNDEKAFRTLQAAIELSRQGRERYVRLYGPVSIDGLTQSESYVWPDDPWPWNICEREG